MYYNLLFVYIIKILIIPHMAMAQNTTITSIQPTTIQPLTTFMTTPALTVSSLVVGFLETAMGNRLNITEEYCFWNVTLMIHLINETDPFFLYKPTTKALLFENGYLPTYIIRQFPDELLSFYGLNFTESQSTECNSNRGTTPSLDIDFCIGPLIHSDHLNPINEDADVERISLKNITGLDIFINASMSNCGLECSAGAQIYGLNDEEQNAVDLCKIIGCTLCFLAISFLAINQYLDQKRTGKKFVDKSLLQIIPSLITIALFLLVLLMTIGEIIGKESIVCLHSKYGSEFSFYNPTHGKNVACTIHGLWFLSALNLYQCYTVLLTFVIFRQLYSPLRPLWDIPQKYWHIGVFVFVLLLDILSLITSGYSGVFVMGVCLPGSSIKEQLFVYINMPFMLSCISSFLLLCASYYLLKKEISAHASRQNTSSTLRMQDLLNRLIYYGIGVVITMILLCWSALEFYVKSDVIGEDMNSSIKCQISQILLDPDIVCPERTAKVSPFFFISWIIAAIMGITAQIVLSCHAKARNRLKIILKLSQIVTDSGGNTGSPVTRSPVIELTGTENNST
eukprot:247323_1